MARLRSTETSPLEPWVLRRPALGRSVVLYVRPSGHRPNRLVARGDRADRAAHWFQPPVWKTEQRFVSGEVAACSVCGAILPRYGILSRQEHGNRRLRELLPPRALIVRDRVLPSES